MRNIEAMKLSKIDNVKLSSSNALNNQHPTGLSLQEIVQVSRHHNDMLDDDIDPGLLESDPEELSDSSDEDFTIKKSSTRQKIHQEDYHQAATNKVSKMNAI